MSGCGQNLHCSYTQPVDPEVFCRHSRLPVPLRAESLYLVIALHAIWVAVLQYWLTEESIDKEYKQKEHDSSLCLRLAMVDGDIGYAITIVLSVVLF